MLWVGVAIGNHPAELLVATAALHLIELHDAALTARREGGVFDPTVEGVEHIYGKYALRRRLGDEQRPYWLSASTAIGWCDIDAARSSLGAFARGIERVDVDVAPCIGQFAELDTGAVEALAEELGCQLPRDAHRRISALIAKHMPETSKPPTNVADFFKRAVSVSRHMYASVETGGTAAERSSDDEADADDDAEEERLARRTAKRRRLALAGAMRI